MVVRRRSQIEYNPWKPGLKTGMENDMFWSEIGSRLGDPAKNSVGSPRDLERPTIFVPDDDSGQNGNQMVAITSNHVEQLRSKVNWFYVHI